MDLQLIIDIGVAATALAGLIGLPVAVLKLWPIIQRSVNIMTEVEKLPMMAIQLREVAAAQTDMTKTLDTQNVTLADQSETLEDIRHEVTLNDGSSVKDAVNRVEEKLDKHLTQPPTTTINIGGGDES